MENVIELQGSVKLKRPSLTTSFLKLVKALYLHYQNFWSSQVDYESVDKKIQEARLKYEIYRMRL